MDIEEFRHRGKEMVDFICEYINTLDKKRVTADVEPCYLRKLLPSEAPEEPEDWDKIMAAVLPEETSTKRSSRRTGRLG
ncbi:hypothetical protein QE152_g39552 [Popillia japonica]|uniref:Uncharacterized protein n=1 Tax=Popillia japonica TaxID=7064 RepID=A0AAW1HTQ8_POPJA